MGNAENANVIAILSAGSNPKAWEQTDLDTSTVPATFDATEVTGAPDSVSSGQAMPVQGGVGSLRTLVGVDIRSLAKSHVSADDDVAEVNHRTARLTISNFVASSEYTVTIDANVVTTAAQPYADVAAAIAAIAAAITADTPAGAGDVVTATAIDADGDLAADTLLLKGKAEADYVIDTVSASGAGTVACIADPAGASLRIWTSRTGVGVNSAGNPRHPGWRLPEDGTIAAFDYRGWEDRIDTGGLGRVYLEVHTVVGVVSGAGDDGSITYAYRAWIEPGILVGAA